MNCANHPDAAAAVYCRTCGKALCTNCRRDVRGVIYCEECLASHLTMPPGAVPVAQPPSVGANPIAAAVLGFIPGVGAMYNGEFAKGFVHVLIFATLIWLAQNISPLFGLGIAAFVLYMPIEAYRTARARELGLTPPDPFGFNNLFSSPSSNPAPTSTTASSSAVAYGNSPGDNGESETGGGFSSAVPIGAVILIGLGVLFLLNTMGLLNFDWIWRFWPLILIALGLRAILRRRGY